MKSCSIRWLQQALFGPAGAAELLVHVTSIDPQLLSVPSHEDRFLAQAKAKSIEGLRASRQQMATTKEGPSLQHSFKGVRKTGLTKLACCRIIPVDAAHKLQTGT